MEDKCASNGLPRVYRLRHGDSELENHFEVLVRRYCANRDNLSSSEISGGGRYAKAFRRLEDEIKAKALPYAMMVVFGQRPIVYCNEGVKLVEEVTKEIKKRRAEITRIALEGNLLDLEDLLDDLSQKVLVDTFCMSSEYIGEDKVCALVSMESLL